MNKDKNKDSGYISPTSDMKYDDDGFGMMINYPGLSIREWYAGQVLSGLIKSRYANCEDLADEAFNIADAMIERSKL